MPYPVDLPVLTTASFPMLYWGPFATDDDTRYYLGFRLGGFFITVIKSVDKGLTWAEMDGGSAMESSLINPTFSVVVGPDWPVVDPTLYVVYMSVTDDFIHVRRFDTGTDSWGLDFASAKGYNDPVPNPPSNFVGWPCVFKPDGNIFIFGSFDAEQIPPVFGVYYWRIGWMEFDTVLNAFGAYTILISTGGETESWETASAALGSVGRVHLFYFHYDAGPTFNEIGHISVDDDGTANIPQTVVASVLLFGTISAAKTRGTMAATEVYFTLLTLDIPVVDQNDYTLSLVFGVSAANPVWNTTFIKMVTYDALVGTGRLMNSFTGFSDGNDIYEVVWLEEQWVGSSPIESIIMRVTSPDGFAFSAEEEVFDGLAIGYVGGFGRSAGMVTATTLYAVSMDVFDNAGIGPTFNYYWEFNNAIPSPGGGGGGGGGFGGGWVDPGPVLGPVFPNLLVKQYKTPRREGNVYDCCLERFYKLVNGAAIDYHPKACNMVETENGYMFPELGKEFWRRGVIPTPAIIDGDVQVMSLRVPDGYNGLIYGISCRYSGAGFVDGGGDIEWRLQVGPVWVRDMGRVLFQLGSPNQPLQLSDHIRVRSAQTIRWIVNAPNGSGVIVPGLTRITCTIQGWFYPMNRKR
jgi:hypothetical protein